MKKSSLSKRLLFGLLILILVQASLVSWWFSLSMSRNIQSNIERSAANLLLANQQLVDLQLRDLSLKVDHIMTDVKFYDLVYALATNKYSAGLDWKSEMRRLVFSYLGDIYYGNQNCLIDVSIVSPYFNYSNNAVTSYEYSNFTTSELFSGQLLRRPYALWYPTSDISAFMPTMIPNYRNDLARTQSFRLIKRLNISAVQNKEIQVMPRTIPAPYLIMDISPSLFRSAFAAGSLTNNSDYMVIDAEGTIISTSKLTLNGTLIPMDALSPLLKAEDDAVVQAYVNMDEKIMVSCLRSSVNDWYYLLLVPRADIAEQMHPILLMMLMVILFLLLGTSVLITFFVRWTMHPVKELSKKADSLARENGVLDTQAFTDVDRIDHMLDRMNQQIEALSLENLEVEQRERDATILMLEMQINPHFLYNSLNKIHLQLMNLGHDKLAASIYDLSRVLRYSINTQKHVVYFDTELDYLKHYIEAIRTEQNDRFSVYFNIDPRLREAIVPKMLLQPFVENAILHGFENMEAGGIISIEGVLDKDTVLLCVNDNGVGIAKEKLSSVTNGESGKIGCANVHKRIQLLYGKEYGVTAKSDECSTTIRIRLPYVADPATHTAN